MKKILFILCVYLVTLHAFSFSFDIRYLKNSEGLSNSSVNTIFQDSSQLMWFGTWDGLNMYDGREFKVFKPELQSPYSISNNIIRNILEQRNGILWIATDDGINRYSKEDNKFERYFYKTSAKATFKEQSFCIAKNSNNQVFAAVHGSDLFVFDDVMNTFIPIPIEKTTFIRKIFFDKQDRLWVLTEDSLFLLTFSALQTPVVRQKMLFTLVKNIQKVFYDENLAMWIQTYDNQLFKYDMKQNRIEKIFAGELTEPVNDMLFEKDNCFLGTSRNLFSLDYKTKRIHTILQNLPVLSLCRGIQNILWVGTDAQGVWMLTPPREKFHSYSKKDIPSFAGNPVRTFYEADDKNLWFGTKGSGLFLIENKTPEGMVVTKKHFTQELGLQHNSVYSLAGTSDVCWIGTEGEGVNYYHFSNNSLELLQVSSEMKSQNAIPKCVYAIYPQNDTILWVGTSGYGLYRLIVDKQTNPYRIQSYKQYVYQDELNNLNNNIVYSIIPDGETHLWIGTRGGGLNHFDIRNEKFTHYCHSEDTTSLSNDDVLCLYKDKKGNLWVGTSIGLNQLIGMKNDGVVFKRYTENEGIPNNTIHGILEDSNDNIWISTNRGIVRLSPATGKVVSYYQNDGLQDNEFSDGAFHYGKYSGFLYFGGINGYTAFDPSKITDGSYIPSLYLSAFSVNNKEVLLKDYMYISRGKRYLELTAGDKFFSLRFTPLDYLSNAKCELAYQLENYQEEWVMLGTSNTIVFSNLPAGNYTLKVKCSNADKSWSKDYFILPIHILPPFWLTPVAYVIYVFLILLILYIIFRLTRQRLKAKQDIRLQKLEKEKIEEIHQAKLRFFTNIAHEFCNSLTLIYGPCEQLLKTSENFQVRKYTNIIYSNADRMQGLIQQLMDFRKVETGHLDVNIEKIDIQELIKYTIDHFADVAEQKDIRVYTEIASEVAYWPTDRSGFEKILFNLLSNAFKYTPKGESITIKINKRNENLLMVITNTGIGIKPEDQQQIFNRFKMLDRFETQLSKGVISTGIGLALCKSLTALLQGSIRVESDSDESSSFIVELPELEITNKTYHQLESLYQTPLEVKGKIFSPGKNVKVLIVEDDKDIRDFLSDTMNDKYTITEASDGVEALELLKKDLPDIIVTDVYMPRMDGIEFVQKLKEVEVTSFIPVIFLSSEGSDDLLEKGIHAGVDAFLSKPFQARHLEAMIENILWKRKKLKDYYDSPMSGVEPMDGKLVHKEDKEFILTLTKVIFENLDKEKLSLDILAHEMGMSKIQLYRKLKNITEQTPTEFIRQIRLKHAEKLLKSTNKTVQEIMYSCGFNNKTYFYREFAKQYHQTPKEYRNKSVNTQREREV